MNYLFGLLRMINAAITPGTQPSNVNIKTMITDPQPLSITASGGNKTDKITLQILIFFFCPAKIRMFIFVKS